MGMGILGLVSTDTTGNQRWTNIRRKVFYQYPNGSAPLIGILSLMKEEMTNDPEFSWWEKRLLEQASLSPAAGVIMTDTGASNIVWSKTSGDNSITTFVLASGNVTFTSGSDYGITIQDASLFRVGHVIQVLNLVTGTTTTTFRGIIRAIDRSTTPQRLAVTCISTTPAVTYNAATGGVNNTGNNAQPIQVIGSSFAQGVTNQTTEVYYLPINIGNFTQIFRTPFSFTGTELVTPVKFDDTGIYKDKAKSHSIDHMIEMELGFIFGQKYRNVSNVGSTGPNFGNTLTPNPSTGAGLPQYTTGGILWFLQQWERGGTTANTDTSPPPPNAATAASFNVNYGNTPANLDSDDNKRIIANASGNMNEITYDTYLERLFRTTSNVSNEKLVLCGSGFLKVVNQMYRSLSTFVYHPPSGDTYGMEIVAHKTAFGTVYYKTHPLFSRNATLRNNALFIDVHNLRYRPMDKRDTQLLKNRQPNDADYRQDEWFSETGLELRMPESFMYIQNVVNYVP